MSDIPNRVKKSAKNIINAISKKKTEVKFNDVKNVLEHWNFEIEYKRGSAIHFSDGQHEYSTHTTHSGGGKERKFKALTIKKFLFDRLEEECFFFLKDLINEEDNV